MKIPSEFEDLFERRSFGHLATLMPDGAPQTTPVWVARDGDQVVINTTTNRQKFENLQRDPRVAISLQDPENPYRYLELRGRVSGVTSEGADEQIDRLAKRYLGRDHYPFRQPGEERVIVRIAPQHATWMNIRPE